jgi:presenilin-like A22 family membrane protease
MKHNIGITALLVLFFFTAEIFGLFAIAKDIEVERGPSGEVIGTSHPDTAVGERPNVSGSGTLVYLAVSVLIGTVLILLLARFKKTNLWKFWFFLAVWSAMSITLGVFLPKEIAIGIALALALIKVLKPEPIMHNLTEVLTYAGIAVLLVPLVTGSSPFAIKSFSPFYYTLAPFVNSFWAFALLIAFSVYDIIAVWKSRHMVKLAKFQMDSNVFAGFFVPYHERKEEKRASLYPSAGKSIKTHVENPGRNESKKGLTAHEATAPQNVLSNNQKAILGGGDIALPLVFTGAVMEQLIIVQQISKQAAFFKGAIIALFATAALSLLLIKSEKGRFYPAMPFLTAGCIAGCIVVALI